MGKSIYLSLNIAQYSWTILTQSLFQVGVKENPAEFSNEDIEPFSQWPGLSHKIYSDEICAMHQAKASSKAVSIPNGGKILGCCSSSPEATGLNVTNVMESNETNQQSKVNCSPETDGPVDFFHPNANISTALSISPVTKSKRPKQYTCKICIKNFSCRQSFYTHNKNKHKVKLNDQMRKFFLLPLL